jgi:hypothetical protein
VKVSGALQAARILTVALSAVLLEELAAGSYSFSLAGVGVF